MVTQFDKAITAALSAGVAVFASAAAIDEPIRAIAAVAGGLAAGVLVFLVPNKKPPTASG